MSSDETHRGERSNFIRRAVFALGMAAATAARLGGLRLIEVLHCAVGTVDEAVGMPDIILRALAELDTGEEGAVLRAGAEVHISLIPLIDPLDAARLRAAVRTGDGGDGLIRKGSGLALISAEGVMAQRLRLPGVVGRLIVRHAGGEDLLGLGVEREPLDHVELGADEGGIVRVPKRVVRDTGLLDLKVLHSAGKGFLVLVPAGLEIIDKLEIDPVGDPVPVKIVDDNILLHDALIVTAPGDEADIVPAPGAKLLQRVGKGDTMRKAVFIKAGYFLHLIVHTLKINGLDINGKFLAGGHILVELDGADLYNFPAEMDGELVENG